MEEVAAGAALCGHPLPRDSIEKAWAAHDTAVDYRSSMQLDYAARHRLELEAIYAAPLEAVARAGGSMPRVQMLYQVLCFLDERNRA
ncbi:2-dehydropantoate 2-reductase [compost metagenome]